MRNQIWATGAASSIWPMRSRRTLEAMIQRRTFADDAAVLHAFVLAAVAFVVLHGAEDLRAEQAVAFGLERAVVDGLRLLDFAVGPFADILRRGDGNLNGFQIADLARIGGSELRTEKRSSRLIYMYSLLRARLRRNGDP